MEPDDETAITEITILPDGRVCVFGASRDVLDALAQLESPEGAARKRIDYAKALDREAHQIEMRRE